MTRPRIMPALLMLNGRLVKTRKFREPRYVGDPVNAIKIYNTKQVDELILLDIGATPDGHEPPFELLKHLTAQCFMPLCYGGGIRHVDEVRRLFAIGIEKVSLNTAAIENPTLVRDCAREFGSQSIVVSIDVRRRLIGSPEVRVRSGTMGTGLHPIDAARTAEAEGAGEILLTSIDREGTWEGYDTEIVAGVSAAVRVPVVASGGAGHLGHIRAVLAAGASAAAIGSMAVFAGRGQGVLIGFPSQHSQRETLSDLQ